MMLVRLFSLSALLFVAGALAGGGGGGVGDAAHLASMSEKFVRLEETWAGWASAPDALHALYDNGKAKVSLRFGEAPASSGTFDEVMKPFEKIIKHFYLSTTLHAVSGPMVVFEFTDAFTLTNGCSGLLTGVAVSRFADDVVVEHDAWLEYSESWSRCLLTLDAPALPAPLLSETAADRLLAEFESTWYLPEITQARVDAMVASCDSPTTPITLVEGGRSETHETAALLAGYSAASKSMRMAATKIAVVGDRTAVATFGQHVAFKNGCSAVHKGVTFAQYNAAGKLIGFKVFQHENAEWARCVSENLGAAQKAEL